MMMFKMVDFSFSSVSSLECEPSFLASDLHRERAPLKYYSSLSHPSFTCLRGRRNELFDLISLKEGAEHLQLGPF